MATGQYRVKHVRRMQGGSKKQLILERVQKPIVPKD